MIEGFKLRITSSELKTHCEGRVKYHRGRAETKSSQIPNLKAAMDAIKATADAKVIAQMTKFSNSYNSDDPVGDLEKDITEHLNKALVFEFFSTHLFDDDYTRVEGDLQRLEILKR